MNASEEEPGDEVGVLVPWEPASIFDKLDRVQLNEILDDIKKGITDAEGLPLGETEDGLPAEPFSPDRRGGGERWAGNVVMRKLACSEQDAKLIIKRWVKSGILGEYRAKTPSSKGSERLCLRVLKRPT